MGVATFETREALPADVRDSLPSVELLQNEFVRALAKQAHPNAKLHGNEH